MSETLLWRGSMKVKPQPPLLSFRVYPNGRFFYAEVNVWPSKKAMYAHRPLNRNHEACCTGMESINFPARKRGRKQRPRRTGLFAEVNFYRRSLGVGVVSHEFTHAGFCYAARRRWDIGEISRQSLFTLKKGILSPDSVEENVCYAVGEMTRQFTQKLYDKGLYKETMRGC